MLANYANAKTRRMRRPVGELARGVRRKSQFDNLRIEMPLMQTPGASGEKFNLDAIIRQQG